VTLTLRRNWNSGEILGSLLIDDAPNKTDRRSYCNDDTSDSNSPTTSGRKFSIRGPDRKVASRLLRIEPHAAIVFNQSSLDEGQHVFPSCP